MDGVARGAPRLLRPASGSSSRKAARPRANRTYAEAVELALCFGWIDGQKAAYDEHFWLQRFTARGPRSRWSQSNREKAIELIRRGAMRPAGLAEVERAKRRPLGSGVRAAEHRNGP